MMTLGSVTAVNSAQAQTSTTNELLSGILGTYSLTFFDADENPENNRGLTPPVKVTFIVAADGRLCTPDLNLTGGVASTVTSAVAWTNTFADLQINLRLIDSNNDQVFEFQEIDYRSATGAPIGRFSLAAPGDFSAGTGTCGASTDPTAAQLNTFFSNAETAFGALFPSGPFTFTQTSAGSSFRFYASTGITLAVTAGQVLAKGGGYGTDFIAVGRFSDLTANINNIIRPATVPAFFTGTYRTNMSDTQPFSPIADGAEVRYVITASGQLCLSNRKEILNPLILDNNTDFAAWIDTVQNRSYRQRIVPEPGAELDAALGLLQVFSLSGLRFGELSGERTSLDAFCTDLFPQHPDTVRAPRIETLFGLKEQLFPELYPASPIVQTQRTSEYTFRFYPQTNRFIAVKDGFVFEGTGTVSVTGAPVGELEQVISATNASTSPYVPASFLVGTYDMVVSGASPLSTAPNGTRIRMVLASNGTLCVDNVSLTSPTVPRSALSDVSWTNMQVGLNAFMVAPATQSALTVHLTSSLGDSLGRLDGSRVSTRATCPGAAPSAADISAAEEYFILAERKFPDLLPAQGEKVDRTASGAITRLYRGTDVTVSIVAGEVFVRGGSFGTNDILLGNLTTLLPELRTEVGQATKAAVIPAALIGTYDMLVTGATPISPFAGSNRVRLVIGSNGDLCLDNLISSNPRSEYTSTQIARWTHASTDINATIDFTDTSSGLSVALRNSVATSLGTLSGTRISSNTFCSPLPLSTASVQLIEEFFMLGERRYPDVLPGGAFTQLTNGPAVTRTYESSTVVMSVVNNQVFVRGGSYGLTDTLFGNFTTLLSELRTTVGGDTRAATVPASLSGTYEMQVSGASPLAPFANNSRVRVVFRPNGELCLDNQISGNPRSPFSSPQQIRWTYTSANFVADLNTSAIDTATSSAVSLSLANTAGTSFGTLTGSRVSAETQCSTAPLTAANLLNISEFFLLAERKYADLFPAGNTVSLTTGPSVSKRYEPNGLVLTVFNNQIFVRGGQFGTLDVFFGNFDSTLQNLRVDASAPNRPAVVPATLAGAYDMLVSGANPISPFANNTQTRVVLRTDGSLCINNLISSNPRSEYVTPQILRWTNTAAQLTADINVSDTTTGLVVSLRNSDGASQGTLTGTRISNDTYCSDVAPDTNMLQLINELFLLAERQYPDLLPAGSNITQTSGPAVSRRYAGNGLVLTVINKQIFARGAEFGAIDVGIGNMDTLLTELRVLVGEDTRAAVIPPALFGTYDMVVSGGSPSAPFATNSNVRVVVRQNGELCLNNLISSNPRSDYGILQIANWTFTSSNFVASANTADTVNGLSISLRNAAGVALGSLTGDRVSTETFCSAGALSAQQLQTANELFMLAERQYPVQLPVGSGTTQTTGPAVRRSYAGNGLVLTVIDNKVLARGGEFGATDVEVGPADALLTELRTLVGAENRAAVIPVGLAGTYDLLVSGANPFAPFANNSRLRVVINSNGELCLNNIISADPRSDYGNLMVATWTNNQAGLVARLDMTDVSNGIALQLNNKAGNSLGTLTGPRVNTDTYCSATALSSSEIQTINSFFELAERRSPASFPVQSTNNILTAAGAVWKTYSSSSTDATATTVLSVVNNQVFVRGGLFGVTDFNLGTLPALTSQWLAEVGAPPPQIAQYNVKVTGNALVSVAGLSSVNRQLNITRQQTYSLTELADENLPVIARALLSGEITSPDSTVISNISRNNGVLTFRATLTRTTVVGSSTTFRQIEAQITLSL